MLFFQRQPGSRTKKILRFVLVSAIVFIGGWSCWGAFFFEAPESEEPKETVVLTPTPDVFATLSDDDLQDSDGDFNRSDAKFGDFDADSDRSLDSKVLAVPVPFDVERATVYPGRVAAFKKSILTFRVSGPIIKINVVPGQVVKKGDPLMQIDPRDYQIQVELAQSRLDAAKANLEAMKKGARPEDVAILQAKVDEAKASCDLTEKEYQRNQKLVESKAVSVAEYDDSNRAFVLAKLAYNSAQKELEKGLVGARVEDVKATEATIDGLEAALFAATNSLDDATLRAPYDGIVTTRLIEEHEMATTTPTYRNVLGIHDISRLKIEVYVPEREMIRDDWSPGRTVKVRFTVKRENLYDAGLYEIDTEPSEVGMTYKLTFVLDRPKDLPVLPGMIGEVLFPDESPNE